MNSLLKAFYTIGSFIEKVEDEVNCILNNQKIVSNSKDALLIFESHFSKFPNLNSEIALILTLDKFDQIISLHSFTQNEKAEVFIPENALHDILSRKKAVSFYLGHNHTENKLSWPSKNDCLTTDNILKLGNEWGKKLKDHLIISSDNYYSFKNDKNLI